jgi:CBS domain-containing protein
VIGALGFAFVGLVVPRALGVGYDAITDTLLGRLAVGSLAILGLAKLVAWWVALASGTSGGTLAPILLVGATFGALAGHAANAIVPGLHVAPGAFALVAMAATFGAATRATFTSIVFVFELTGDYQVILPLMLAGVVALLVASALMTESLMTEKLARRGLTVRGDYEVDLMRTTSVRSIMTTDVRTLRADATMADAHKEFRWSGHGAYPLVDEAGACVAILTRGDLLRRETASRDDGAGEPALAVASRAPVVVGPAALGIDALHLILQEEVEHLPVVENGRLVGICTRTDLLRSRLAQLEMEQAQPGWRRPSRRRAAETKAPAVSC